MKKIIQLTDLHFVEYPLVEKDEQTLKLIEKIINNEEPDLIAITGDLIISRAENSLESFKYLIDFIDSFNIDVAITYGNHDTESSFTRLDLHEVVDNMKNHVTKKERQIFSYDRECYYYDFDDSTRLFFVDTGDYTTDGFGFYAYTDYEMNEWLIKHSTNSNQTGHLFVHLPLPEYGDAIHLNELRNYPDDGSITSSYNRRIATYGSTVDGNYYEPVASPLLNTGLFSRMLLESNIKSVYCGHEHDNDFSVNHLGILLNYGRVTGVNTYGVLKRGARIIEINENNFITYVKGYEL